MQVVKAHAYGNDFLLVPAASVPREADPGALSRRLCNRHHGVGADGLILYRLQDGGAAMTLFNADGSPSELSGNGLRCLAGFVARTGQLPAGSALTVDTGAGLKRLELVAVDGARFTFRGNLGSPTALRQEDIEVAGERVTASILGMGNPQLVVLGPLPDAVRFARLGPALSTHPMFPAGTNVEFAHVESADRVRILIWERGVGPTSSSGTGTAAAAVAAAAHGGAARALDVVAPGGTQRVEWTAAGVHLTGWAEVLLEGEWVA